MTIPRHRTASRRFGFSLMETVLAIALTAVVMSLVAAAINIYARVVSSSRADVTNAQVARNLLQLVADDLRSCYQTDSVNDESSASIEDDTSVTGDSTNSTTSDLTNSTTSDLPSSVVTDLTGSTAQASPGLYGNATELQLDIFGQYPNPVRYDLLVGAGMDAQTANLLSDPKVVTYYLRPMMANELVGTPLEIVNPEVREQNFVLVRRVQSRAEAQLATTSGVADVEQGEQLLSDQVLSVTFAYFDGLSWLSDWDSSVMGSLPLAVQATIVVDTDERAIENASGSILQRLGAVSEMNSDNTYQITVQIPTAEIIMTDETTAF